MQGWHYDKGLIYYRPIFRLTKLAFLRARAIPREKLLLSREGGVQFSHHTFLNPSPPLGHNKQSVPNL